ncbi:energy transducer TonB [Aeromonas schubertii]|uniref:MotA/TolQ/ExbB proton channel family protein n=1 Tax=Aeromonas schubertii TaxID=652 RepID=UPI00067F6BD6|nr:MotA/TolQ/ExbB proton channel family protein [Aeromonas schubertii]KUE79226.1 energy transducer TonB [Aeromonas schubertii]
MKALPLILALAFGVQAAPQFSAEEQAREQAAGQELATLKSQLAQAKAKLASAQAESLSLGDRFASNEKQLSELNKAWLSASSGMDELFAVSRQGAKEAMTLLEASAVQAQYPDRLQPLHALSDDKTVPDRYALALLSELLLGEMKASAQVARFSAQVNGAEGVATTRSLTRFGAFTLAAEPGLVQVTPQGLLPIANLPGKVLDGYRDYQGAEGEAVAIDPSHGAVLAMLAEMPTFTQRLQQGGTVGYIILALALAGLGIAGVRLVLLSHELKAVRRQVGESVLDERNALGRVLAVEKQYPHLPMETLELRLDEAILQENPRLERGIGMVKVIAAVAPMLGLLGTVTGMIGTFQAITQFGTGDPKIMAGGISMALVTTVQGLVAAIPLILAHSLLQSRFSELSNLLEQQVAGILAERAETTGLTQSKTERVA